MGKTYGLWKVHHSLISCSGPLSDGVFAAHRQQWVIESDEVQLTTKLGEKFGNMDAIGSEKGRKLEKSVHLGNELMTKIALTYYSKQKKTGSKTFTDFSF